MKYEKLIYSLGAVFVIIGSLLKILHLPYANIFLYLGLIGSAFFQAWHVQVLKKRIAELEKNDIKINLNNGYEIIIHPHFFDGKLCCSFRTI